ncbi:hypothetical protein [Nocardia otitidiscaviarum]|uniref:hypothetical protein n=1 Tax=Nocardia otitidiscaviarum TaxID=1823 RepID=UPI000584CFD9|nr:hypothetical protein [Nocardia otitidiscaviarum]MBF6236624.1 hypothetical protein [Nocardia otitidiscaviarum]
MTSSVPDAGARVDYLRGNAAAPVLTCVAAVDLLDRLRFEGRSVQKPAVASMTHAHPARRGRSEAMILFRRTTGRRTTRRTRPVPIPVGGARAA